jgi:hypothetical protein
LVRQSIDHRLKRSPKQLTFLLNKIEINGPDLFERSSLAGSLRRFSPAVLHYRPERGLRCDWHLVLTGRMAQDANHLRGAFGTGRDEDCVRRMQCGPTDRLSIRNALLAQPVTVIVGVSAQLDVSHVSILLGNQDVRIQDRVVSN